MVDRERMQESAEEIGPLQERVVHVRRVSKTVAGGRRFSFSAAVAVGDGRGHVGIGLGKAKEAPAAIRKAVAQARRSMIKVPIVNDTIPHELWAKFSASRVLLKPARPGTGVIAGGPVRAVVEVAGIRNITTKALGSRNPLNVMQATFKGLSQLRDPRVERARRLGRAMENGHERAEEQ
jgi:small subunit ribosomal protein S5